MANLVAQALRIAQQRLGVSFDDDAQRRAKGRCAAGAASRLSAMLEMRTLNGAIGFALIFSVVWWTLDYLRYLNDIDGFSKYLISIYHGLLVGLVFYFVIQPLGEKIYGNTRSKSNKRSE